jgi:hypothetical protein
MMYSMGSGRFISTINEKTLPFDMFLCCWHYCVWLWFHPLRCKLSTSCWWNGRDDTICQVACGILCDRIHTSQPLRQEARASWEHLTMPSYNNQWM